MNRPSLTDPKPSRRIAAAAGRIETAGPPSRAIAIAVFLVALAARLAWIASVHPAQGVFDDTGYYDFFAKSLAAGGDYRMPWGTPTAFWPPGYPAVLAVAYRVFGSSAEVATVLNAVIGALTAVVVLAIGRRLLTPRQALLGAVIFALLPGAIGFSSLALSETLFTFTFAVAIYVLVAAAPEQRPIAAVTFGLAVAAATYVRGQALLLPLVAVPWLVHEGWRLRDATGFAVASLLVAGLACLPWAVRNTLTFHHVVLLSTNVGTNIYAGHHAGANGALQIDDQVAFIAPFKALPEIEQEPASNDEGARQGVAYALHHPSDELRLSERKVVRLFRDDSDAIRWNEHNGGAPLFKDRTRARLRLALDGSFYVAGIAALVATVVGLARGQSWALLFALVTLYWVAVHIVFFAEPRFHVPLLPLIALGAGAATGLFARKQRPFVRPGSRRGRW